MNIITDIEQLSNRCDEVLDLRKESKEVQRIILALKDTIREQHLTGLAANQLGFDKRIMVVAFGDDLRTFINPVISNAKDLMTSIETCPSLPGKKFLRLRNQKVSVTYIDPLGKVLMAKDLIGKAAAVVQELIEHLDGVVLSDIGLELETDFDAASEEEKEELIRAYCDSMDVKLKDTQAEIEATPELKKISDAAKLLTKIQSGDVVIETSTVKKVKNN